MNKVTGEPKTSLRSIWTFNPGCVVKVDSRYFLICIYTPSQTRGYSVGTKYAVDLESGDLLVANESQNQSLLGESVREVRIECHP